MKVKQQTTSGTILSDDWWMSEAIVGILLLQMTHMVSVLNSSCMNAWCYHLEIFSSYLMCDLLRVSWFSSLHSSARNDPCKSKDFKIVFFFHIFARRSLELWSRLVYSKQYSIIGHNSDAFSLCSRHVHQTSFSSKRNFKIAIRSINF